MKRYSVKRQAIIDCLKKTKTHPTAEWIYGELKEKFPSLSLATVYRNLNELKEEGSISSLGKVLNKERFDGTTIPHNHVICCKCGKVIDLSGIELPKELIKKAQSKTGYKLNYSSLQFFGLCEKCKKEKGSDK